MIRRGNPLTCPPPTPPPHIHTHTHTHTHTHPTKWFCHCKIEMLSEYQLKIVDLYNIPIGNDKKLVPNIFDKENMSTYNL